MLMKRSRAAPPGRASLVRASRVSRRGQGSLRGVRPRRGTVAVPGGPSQSPNHLEPRWPSMSSERAGYATQHQAAEQDEAGGRATSAVAAYVVAVRARPVPPGASAGVTSPRASVTVSRVRDGSRAPSNRADGRALI